MWGYSPLIWVISIVTLRITPHITTHEPPSNPESTALSPKASVAEVAQLPALGAPMEEVCVLRGLQLFVFWLADIAGTGSKELSLQGFFLGLGNSAWFSS